MAASAVDRVLLHLRRSACAHLDADVTDAELLQRYVAPQDEAAFETLLTRHGPLRLGACCGPRPRR